MLARAPAYQSTPFPSSTLRAVDVPPTEPEAAIATESGLPPSETTNVWPDEAAEAAFISESRGRGEVVAVATPQPAPEMVEEKPGKPLPKLDDLVQRIPDEARELLEDLFRAKFVAVRRVPQNALKP